MESAESSAKRQSENATILAIVRYHTYCRARGRNSHRSQDWASSVEVGAHVEGHQAERLMRLELVEFFSRRGHLARNAQDLLTKSEIL
jgi:hypothetical protein